MSGSLLTQLGLKAIIDDCKVRRWEGQEVRSWGGEESEQREVNCERLRRLESCF